MYNKLLVFFVQLKISTNCMEHYGPQINNLEKIGKMAFEFATFI